MAFLNEAVIAIVAALVGSVATMVFEHYRDRKKTHKKEFEALHKTRPEFKIISMKNSFSKPGACISSQPCDLEVFVAPFSGVSLDGDCVHANYDEMLLDIKSWVCRQYTFKNIGQTAVYTVSVISNFKKGTCLFNKNSPLSQLLPDGVLNYWEMLDKRIGPNETFTLKLCYHKEKIPTGSFSAIMCLAMCDDNNNDWEQPFFAPHDKLYESRKISYSEYQEGISSDTAIKCFKESGLW